MVTIITLQWHWMLEMGRSAEAEGLGRLTEGVPNVRKNVIC